MMTKAAFSTRLRGAIRFSFAEFSGIEIVVGYDLSILATNWSMQIGDIRVINLASTSINMEEEPQGRKSSSFRQKWFASRINGSSSRTA
jgi:hypothetical protein